jgi:hypothetical protein
MGGANCTATSATVDNAGDVDISVNCGTTTPPPTAGVPTGCKLYASKTSATVGDAFTVYGKCTGGEMPVTFALTGTDVPTVQTLIQDSASVGSALYSTTGSAAKTYSFTANATNAAGAATSVTGTSVVVSNVVVPPPSSGTISCSAQGFQNTRHIKMNWNNTARLYTKDYGGFESYDALVLELAVPADAAVSSFHVFSGAEWIDLGVPRVAYLSKNPCDFSTATLGMGSTAEGTSFSLNFSVGTSRVSKYVPAVAPGTTVYVNLKNANAGACSGTCNLFATFK